MIGSTYEVVLSAYVAGWVTVDVADPLVSVCT